MAELLDVSTDTVRRDITTLHQKKKLKKVHGGAISLGFNTYDTPNQEIYAIVHKRNIARKAVKLLKDGQVLLISGGTTNVEIVKLIPPNMGITCFTPSLQVAIQLLTKPSIDTIFIGGKLSHNSQITVGGSAIETLSQIKADICFLGTNSINAKDGLMEFDWDIVQIKKAMIKASKRVVSPAISEKLNSVQRYKICDLTDIDVLITELHPTANELQAFTALGINVL